MQDKKQGSITLLAGDMNASIMDNTGYEDICGTFFKKLAKQCTGNHTTQKKTETYL